MTTPLTTQQTQWFAIRTLQDFRAEEALADVCDEVFFPKTTTGLPGGRRVERPLIPHVLFLRTTRDEVLELEKNGRQSPETNLPFWIYRYPKSIEPQVIPPASIHLLRLLTADDAARCEVFTDDAFTVGTRVRVTGGIFRGYEGHVRRIHKDRRVVVQIEGVCAILLPFIHPDLLSPLP